MSPVDCSSDSRLSAVMSSSPSGTHPGGLLLGIAAGSAFEKVCYTYNFRAMGGALFGGDARSVLLLRDQPGEHPPGADSAAVAGEDDRLQVPEILAGHQPVDVADDRHVL